MHNIISYRGIPKFWHSNYSTPLKALIDIYSEVWQPSQFLGNIFLAASVAVHMVAIVIYIASYIRIYS